jgi:hypothetical protein
MPPKKAEKKEGGAGKGEEDMTCELFIRAYRKNCQTLGIEFSPDIKKMLEELEEEPITKVS